MSTASQADIARETVARLRRTVISYADAEAILAAIPPADWRPPPRVIKDPAEADRLPAGTVVINDGGQVAQRYDGMGVWWQVLDGDQLDSRDLIGTGWITVLHTPAAIGDTDA